MYCIGLFLSAQVQQIQDSVQEIPSQEDGDENMRRHIVVHHVMPQEREAIYQSIKCNMS